MTFRISQRLITPDFYSAPCTCILQSILHLGNPATNSITNIPSRKVSLQLSPITLPQRRKLNLSPLPSLTPLCLPKCSNIPRSNRGHSTTTQITCWKCDKELVGSGSEFGYLLCPSCGSPQELRDGSGGLTFYQLLSHPESYAVNVEKLAATARTLQKRLHPDLFAGRGKVKSSDKGTKEGKKCGV